MTSGFRHALFGAGLAAGILIAAIPVFAQQPPVPGTGANFEMRLEALEDQMRSLNGRIEQLEFSVKRLDQSMQRLQTDTDARLAKLESSPPAAAVATPAAAPPVASNIAPAVSEPAASPATANGTLGAIKMQDGRITGAVNNPQAPPLPDAPPDYSLTSQEQYDRAFDLLREANYD